MVKYPWSLLEISLSDFRRLATLNMITYLPTYVADISVKTSSLLLVVGISTMTKTDPFHTLQGLIQSRDQIVVTPRVNIATTLMRQEHTTIMATSQCETYCQGSTRWMKTCCQGDILTIAADICRMKEHGDENIAKWSGNEKGEKICPK